MPTTPEEKGFLKALKEDSADLATRLAYADWLEEHDRKHEAVQQRVKANVSTVIYKIRRKSDGLFADKYGGWGVKGKEWQLLSSLKGHLTSYGYYDNYARIPWNEVEVVAYEIRLEPTVVLTLTHRRGKGDSGQVILSEGPLNPAS